MRRRYRLPAPSCTHQYRVEDNQGPSWLKSEEAFLAAANPAAVLALIGEVEAAYAIPPDSDSPGSVGGDGGAVGGDG